MRIPRKQHSVSNLPAWSAAIALLLLTLSVSGFAQQPLAATFMTIDFPNAVLTHALGIGPGGDIVGYYKDAAGTTHGFLLRNGHFTSIDYPGAIYTDARGISPGGDIVGSFKDAPGDPPHWHGFLLSRVTGAFTEIQVPGYMGTIAQRITPTGAIYGCSHDTDFGLNMRGFVRNAAGSYTVFDVPSSMHNGATPDGSTITGLYSDMTTGLSHAYFVVNGDFQPFDFPGSNWTQGWDINPAGETVGQFRDSSGQFHGFLLAGGMFSIVDPPGSIATAAVGINPAGVIVGWYTDAGGQTHAFVAFPTGA
jgi:uncharacterized membrane protein